MSNPVVVAISDHHRRSLSLSRGPAGLAWLAELPRLVAECARRWSLRVEAPFPGLWHNYVAPAVCADGRPAVLKLAPPGDREFHTEVAALEQFDGAGCARVYAVDRERRAVLIERLLPGTPLLALEDDERMTAVAADVMRQLWRPVPADHPFPTVAYWGSGFQRLLRARFDGTTGPLPEALVSRAEVSFAELLGSMDEPVLLHGDLHHENILRAERQPWLAIDPKGVVGEPAYEVGALLRNALPERASPAELTRLQRRRIAQLAELLGFDAQRLRAWGFAQAVLSAVWSIDDGGDGQASVACAESLSYGP